MAFQESAFEPNYDDVRRADGSIAEPTCYSHARAIVQELTRKLMENSDLEPMDQILRDEDVATPLSSTLFKPEPIRIGYTSREAPPSEPIANQLAYKHVEPSDEPCTEEIPWSDLVFWLGNATGQVECSCSSCIHHRSHGRVAVVGPEHHAHTQLYIPTSVYKHLSAKIPLIAVPRIEGIN